MDISGEERIQAPRDRVWAALNDAAILKQCIPGCQSLEWQSPTGLTATIKVRFGVISVTFTGEITLTNLNGPESYTISAEGKGSIAGFAKGSADVVLEESGSETILHYVAGGDVGGKIAQIGARLLHSVTSKIAAQFFTDFNAAVIAKPNG